MRSNCLLWQDPLTQLCVILLLDWASTGENESSAFVCRPEHFGWGLLSIVVVLNVGSAFMVLNGLVTLIFVVDLR